MGDHRKRIPNSFVSWSLSVWIILQQILLEEVRRFDFRWDLHKTEILRKSHKTEILLYHICDIEDIEDESFPQSPISHMWYRRWDLHKTEIHFNSRLFVQKLRKSRESKSKSDLRRRHDLRNLLLCDCSTYSFFSLSPHVQLYSEFTTPLYVQCTCSPC
jgi:hypothetical protein